MAIPEKIAFGPFEFEPSTGRLTKYGMRIKLQPRAAAVLACVLEHAGETVTREQLQKRLWQDGTYVDFELGIKVAVKKVRDALEDSAEEPKYIQTVHGTGYRFIAVAVPVAGSHDVPGMESRTLETIRRGSAGTHAAAGTGASPSKRKILWVFATTLLVIVVAVVFTVVWRTWRPTAQAGSLPRVAILVGDFENKTGDPIFDGTLRQAVSIDFQQSPYFQIVPDSQIHQALRMMGRAPETRIGQEIGREICQRQGIRALITGSIAALGSRYVILLSALDGTRGDVLASAKTDAAGKEEVIAALGRADANLRSKLADQFLSDRRFSKPLEEVTTSSLEALKEYSGGDEAYYRGKIEDAIPFYERATELDPNFAMAYARLGVSHMLLGDKALSIKYEDIAFTRREHASMHEQFYISGHYYLDVLGNFDKALQTYEVYKRTFPHDAGPIIDFSALYGEIGEVQRQLEEEENVVRENPEVAMAYYNASEAATILGRISRARELMQLAIQHRVGGKQPHVGLYAIAVAQGDHEAMAAQRATAMATRRGRLSMLSFEATLAASQGQLRQSLDLLEATERLAQELNARDFINTVPARRAFFQALLAGSQAGSRDAAAVLAHPADLDASYMLALSWAGQANRALTSLENLARSRPEDTYLNLVYIPAARAVVALDHGNGREAAHVLTVGLRYGQIDPVVLFTRGNAHLAAGLAAEAVNDFAELQRLAIIDRDTPLPALATLGLARAYAMEHDLARSRAAYQEFFAHWSNADPGIALLHQARQEFAKIQ